MSRKVSRFFIVTLLSISMILSVLSIFIGGVVLNKDLYLTLLDKSGAYTEIEDKLYGKMDSFLGSSVDDKIKKSIIKDEDVKKEANIVLTTVINNLKNGTNDKPVIDTQIYKNRVKDVLGSVTGFNDISNTKNDKVVSFNDTIIDENNNKVTINNMSIKANDGFLVQNLATRAELEAQGRAMLRERGMTEAEARKKLAEKGLTEADVWDILEDQGYLDEEDNSEESSQDQSNNSSQSTEEKSQSNSDNEDNKNNSTVNTEENNEKKSEKAVLDSGSNADSESNADSKLGNGKVKDLIKSAIMDKNKSFDEKIKSISNGLADEAEKFIDMELEKLTLSKFIDSKEFIVLAKVTSTLDKLKYVFMILGVVLAGVLYKINNDKSSALKNINEALGITNVFMLIFIVVGYVGITKIGASIIPEYFLNPGMFIIKDLIFKFVQLYIVLLMMNVVMYIVCRIMKKRSI